MTPGMLVSRDLGEDASLFQLLVLFLSIFVLGAIMAQTFFRLPAELDALLRRLDTLICFVFIGDFFYRLCAAESKKAFLRWGWIDLVSSIPAIEILRWGRLLRILRLVRVLRAFRSVKVVLQYLYLKRDRAAFSTVIIATFLAAIFSSIAILTFENAPGANIVTAQDGLWWSFYTLANIDYTGHYPVTAEGKLIRLLLVVAGMVLFGVFVGYAASFFLEDEERKETKELENLRREVENLREDLGKRPG